MRSTALEKGARGSSELLADHTQLADKEPGKREPEATPGHPEQLVLLEPK